MMSESDASNTYLVVTVFFILVVLVLLLFFLYKHLNRETNNEYTVRKLVLGEGGLRDRVMHGVAAVQTRIGDLRPSRPDEEQALNQNEDGSRGEEKEEGGGGEEDENTEQGHGETRNKVDEKEEEHHDDSPDDCSSVGLKEGDNSKEEEGEKDEEQEKEEGTKDEAKGDDSTQEEVVKDEEKVGLLVDLKPFSGSAIWSEDKTEENNVTAL